MQRSGHVGSLAAAACALALATRLPGPPLASIAGVALAVAAVTLSALAAAGRGAWTAPLALACAGGLLVLPSSDEAWLQVPALLVAAPMLLLFHAVLQPHTAAVPPLPGASSRRMPAILRLVPWLTLALLVAVTPLLALLLPDRLGATSELQGPAGPLLAGVLVAMACLAAALAWRATAPTGGHP